MPQYCHRLPWATVASPCYSPTLRGHVGNACVPTPPSSRLPPILTHHTHSYRCRPLPDLPHCRLQLHPTPARRFKPGLHKPPPPHLTLIRRLLGTRGSRLLLLYWAQDQGVVGNFTNKQTYSPVSILLSTVQPHRLLSYAFTFLFPTVLAFPSFHHHHHHHIATRSDKSSILGVEFGRRQISYTLLSPPSFPSQWLIKA